MVDHETYPQLYDPTAPFVYARLQRASEQEDAGYPLNALATWAERARTWSAGKVPSDLPLLATPERKPQKSRDVFIYMINGFKPKAPAAARALIEQLSSEQ